MSSSLAPANDPVHRNPYNGEIVFAGKPVIGIVGGIGSGKSFVARLFGEEGCLVINSDEQVSEVYRDEEVKQTLRGWWGDEVIGADGQINRRAIAGRVFTDPSQLKRLEGLIHPRVHAARERVMSAAASDDPMIKAFIWDTPLLFETGLNRQCDAVIFVEAPLPVRLQRVRERGWDATELSRRENSQWPLDKKREISDYLLQNIADPGFSPDQLRSQVRDQVRDVLSRILAQSTQTNG
jgi:dephospho-CoA kinase